MAATIRTSLAEAKYRNHMTAFAQIHNDSIALHLVLDDRVRLQGALELAS